MSAHDFEFEEFHENFTLTVDEPGDDWPQLWLTMELVWHAAEPDVGIFSQQSEIRDLAYLMDRGNYTEHFASEDAFAFAIYDLIGDEIEETAEDIIKIVRKQINKWESKTEAA